MGEWLIANGEHLLAMAKGADRERLGANSAYLQRLDAGVTEATYSGVVAVLAGS